MLQNLLPGTCTVAAPVFDLLSARIAEVTGWRVAKLSGSVAKAAAVSLPDNVAIANISDLAGLCHQIKRGTDMDLIVDADDGGGDPVVIWRTVRDLESVGVSAIEIEDNLVPSSFGVAAGRHSLLLPTDKQVANLKAALAARRSPATVISARTNGLTELPRQEAIRRIAAYAQSGVEAITLPALPLDAGEALEEAHAAAGLPLFVLGLPDDLASDQGFLKRNDIRIQYLPQLPFYVAMREMFKLYETMRKRGRADLEVMTDTGEISAELQAALALLGRVTRVDELSAWQTQYEVDGHHI